jgi:tetratricopeptide (TPR) repeat protein
VRNALATAVRVEPARAAVALSALRAESAARSDAPRTARLRVLEARAVHRSGRLDAALTAYADAERLLRRAGLEPEAVSLAVARVDALATAGRIAQAIALAKASRPRVAAARSPRLAASLDVNLGNALRLAGRLEEAERAYARAERVLERAGALDAATVARVDRGVALVERGEVDRARRLFAEGAASFAAKGLVDLARETRTNLAHADLQAGRLGEAVRSLEALAIEHRDAGLPRREALARLDLALALLRAGDREAAEREALRAAAAFGHASARAEQAEAWWVAAAAAGDDVARAAKHLASARTAARACGRPAVALRCDLLAADAALRAGRAPRSLARAAARARALGHDAVAADAEVLLAAAALAAGRHAEARSRFARAARASRGRPWALLDAEAGLATVDALVPARRGRAIARLRRAVTRLDATRAGLPGRWLRATFAAERLDPALALVEHLLARGAPADRAEAERILERIAVRRFDALRPPRAAGARLERARRRLEALYDRLARGEGPSRGAESGPLGVLARRAHAWERAVAAEWKREERRAGSVARSASPRETGEAATGLVRLWRRGDELRALVRAGGDALVESGLGDARDLEGLAAALRLRARRWTLSAATRPGPASDSDATERLLAEVSRRALEPLRAGSWSGRVAIVAGEGVPDLPWEMLPQGDARLGERVEIVRAPCATTAPPRAAGRGTVVVGVGDPALAHVAREVEEVAEAARASRVLLRGDATRAAVLDALASSSVVHLAGHGWDAGDAPPLGGVRLADGWLAAVDLFDRRVSCDLVVLAACRTGRSSDGRRPAWGGLVPALLAAGARRVVWTADDVDDRATASLMGRFHRARRPDDGGRAFGEALAASAREEGHPAPALPFRLSGVLP